MSTPQKTECGLYAIAIAAAALAHNVDTATLIFQQGENARTHSAIKKNETISTCHQES